MEEWVCCHVAVPKSSRYIPTVKPSGMFGTTGFVLNTDLRFGHGAHACPE